MGLFSFFNRGSNNGVSGVAQPFSGDKILPEIPEDVFIEKSSPQDKTNETEVSKANGSGIQLLFTFLEKNHEGKGYDDALMNPDTIHLQENIEALKNELERTIRKTKIFYQDFIREINFHINSRTRSGMVDTVEELTVKKETAENHIQQILEIENDLRADTGIAQGVMISYTRGFRNGLAAISHHSIMKQNF